VNRPALNVPAIILSYGKDVVPRAWIRAQIPDRGIRDRSLSQWTHRWAKGDTGGINRASKKLQDRLYVLEKRGCIQRTEISVVVLDRVGLEHLASAEDWT